ncbi:hypothetical protein MMC10_006090 [Thelotrema lepadinum]|nr:hypothetical protein [Thelotrema lepadinum]
MHLKTTLLPLLSLLTLVVGDACVVGGPADEVAGAKNCCKYYNGTWYENYPVQAICVLPDTSTKYEACVKRIPGPALDLTCITNETDPTSRIVGRNLVEWLARRILGE